MPANVRNTDRHVLGIVTDNSLAETAETVTEIIGNVEKLGVKQKEALGKAFLTVFIISGIKSKAVQQKWL